MDREDVITPVVIFLGVIVAIWIVALTTFGIIKVGANMFDLPKSNPTDHYTSDDRLNCSYRGGTIVAENGEYKDCKLQGAK